MSKIYTKFYKKTRVILDRLTDNTFSFMKPIFPSDIYESKKLAPNITFWFLKFHEVNAPSFIVTEYIVPRIKNPDQFYWYIRDFEENQAINGFPMEIIDEYISDVYDSGENSTIDRYTLIYKDKIVCDIDGKHYERINFFGCSEDPCAPQGVGMHGELKEMPPRGTLGKKIPFQTLPNAVKRYIINEILEGAND